MVDLDDEQRYFPRSGPMFSRGSLARSEMATDLAIPILTEGGWAALTLRNVARAANVTPQAIAAWFPSVTAMRVAVAECYGNRWVRERASLARSRLALRRMHGEALAVSEVVLALLPQTWLEEVYDGVWLTIAEVGRWDESIGRTVAAVRELERDAVWDLVEGDDDAHVEDDVALVLALVHGLRAVRGGEGLAADGRTGERAAAVLVGLGRAG